MESEVKALPEGCDPNQWHWCEKCGALVGIGMWPMCKGRQEDHGPVVGKSSVFPFETQHINGRPMVIESLHHLRQVERQYGVMLSAFSRDKSKWNDTHNEQMPRFRGNDLEYRD